MSQSTNPKTPAVAVSQAEWGGITDSYIIILKEACDTSSHVQWLKGLENKYQPTPHSCGLAHEYDVINGYSATLTGDALDEVANHAEVEAIVQDSEVKIDGFREEKSEQDDGEVFSTKQEAEDTTTDGGRVATFVQNNAPWGLRRVSDKAGLPAGSNPLDLNYNFRHQKSFKPEPVDVYVIDTGIFTQHIDFVNKRARWGATFGGYPDRDGNGHGTHVAGTIGGNRFGAAKNSELIAVKVMGDDGSGKTSDIIAGINWAVQQARSSNRASVINMSLGGARNLALNRAATNAVRAGLHVCVSAGNSRDDASKYSPASAAGVISIGASTIEDRRSDFSNFGRIVDIFAPGTKIISAAISTRTAYVAMSGTSMASPHVAGVVAYLIYLERNRPPNAMLTRLRELAVMGLLKDLPEGTPNVLLQNGFA